MKITQLLKNRYELQEILGRGGFAVTYRAIDTESGEECAVKCLSFRKIEEWKTWELFEREARILKNLNHPKIPRYIDFFTQETGQDVELYLVQAYVAGKSLAQLVQEGRHFTEAEAVRLALKVCDLLNYLHSLSPPIVHRDIKPGNILLDAEDRLSLIDFGAVKDTLLSSSSQSSGAPTVVGTYGYMPLEQIEGRALPQSDLYALGMTLVYILSHKEPTDIEKSGLELDFEHHVNISADFAAIIRKLIAPDWQRRYQSAVEVKADLERLEQKRPVRWKTASLQHRPPAKRRLAILATGIMILGVMGYLFFQTNSSQLPPSPPPAAPIDDAPALNENAPINAMKSVEGHGNSDSAAPSEFDDTMLYTARGRVLFAGQPITDLTTVMPEFSLLNQSTRQHETPEIEYDETGHFALKGLFVGDFSMSVDLDANQQNPIKYPGDFMKWGIEFNVPTVGEIVVDLGQVMHMTSPEDNAQRMTGGVSDEDCSAPTQLSGPVRFAWDSLGDNVTYNYLVGTVDCVEHLYSAGSIVNAYTTDTEVTLELPPSPPNQKYSFHITAEKGGQRIGRLFRHNKGVSNGNYDFQVVEAEQEAPETVTRPAVEGRLLFADRPITDITSIAPTFWFRNEDTGKEQSAKAKYEQGKFSIYGLPPGNFGVSVNLDANSQNPWSYPGDYRAWKPFTVQEGWNPELEVSLLQIIRLTAPQDNNAVMEKWGVECMQKITHKSPVTFRWESVGGYVMYEYRITRMDCANNYNSAGTVAEDTVTSTELTVNLPPSLDNECYGLHLYARRNDQRIGMLITHGTNGYGWDYRFRVQ